MSLAEAKAKLSKDAGDLRKSLAAYAFQMTDPASSDLKVAGSKDAENAAWLYQHLRSDVNRGCTRLGYAVPVHLGRSENIRRYMMPPAPETRLPLIKFIYLDFKPLLVELGAWTAEDDLVLDLKEDGGQIGSRKKGQRTLREIAVAVRDMVPVAQEALLLLIRNEELRLHNLPPEAIELEALDDLRRLHHELGELLKAAERGERLLDRFISVAKSANRVFKVTNKLAITIRGVEVVGLSLVPTMAAVKAMELMFGHPLDGAAEVALAGAIMTAVYVEVGKDA